MEKQGAPGAVQSLCLDAHAVGWVFVPALPVLLEGTQKEASVRPGCGKDFFVQLVFFSAVC